MSFMQPQVWESDYYAIETTCGTEIVDAADVGMKATIADMEDYLEGKVQSPAMEVNEDLPEEYYTKKGKPRILKPKHGWLCWMSAPGYMDRTDLSAFDTEVEAWEHLLDMYGTQDDSEPEDWEEDAEDRVRELQGMPTLFRRPQDGDYITNDYISFYQDDHLVCILADNSMTWMRLIKSHMDANNFYPNVWFQGERGGYDLLDLTTGGFAKQG